MEFGSDFHTCDITHGNGVNSFIQGNYYASGRLALYDLISTHNWRRLWLPSYFCGESMDILNTLPIEVRRYNILPSDNPDKAISSLPLKQDDLLLRMNYFGWHSFCDSSSLPCDVVEDHTHDLIGDWSTKSNAQWAIASLRKTLPVSDGGVLWSPQNLKLPPQPDIDREVSEEMKLRHHAMEMKAMYLKDCPVDKNQYLDIFRSTENMFCDMPVSAPTKESTDIIDMIDVSEWYSRKRINYKILISLLNLRKAYVLSPKEFTGQSTPFSLILGFNSKSERDYARKVLISKQVFPAILWPDVWDSDPNALDYADRMLSIHCDGRYTKEDMGLLATIIHDSIN